MATDFSQNTAAIEGIGPKYAELLGLNGVKTLRDLLSLQPDWLHGQEPALPLGSLRESSLSRSGRFQPVLRSGASIGVK